MARQFGGIGTVVVAVATATCGVLMLGGVGPSPAGARLTGDVLPAVGPVTSMVTSAPVDEPDLSSSTTSTSSPSTSTTPSDVTTTSTTTTTTTSTTTTTVAAAVGSPLPLSVSASQAVVGVDGTVDFAGECASSDGEPVGPVSVWVIGDTTDRIATGVTAIDWTYRWTAPTDPNKIASYTFQFWCGDPTGWQGGYPADLQRTVDMVVQFGPPATTALPLIEVDPPSVIPETD